MSLTPELTIDLGAIRANWRTLDAMTRPGCETAAVVKADAYGCGLAAVGQALAREGAATFFIAMPDEGVRLRAAIGPGPAIYVLAGYDRGALASYTGADLRPVLNTADQARWWFRDTLGPAAIQIDTGMNRLGMEADEFAVFRPLPPLVDLVLSHLGCADDVADPLTPLQLAEFHRLTDGLGIRRSLAATAGLLRGATYHFEMTRAGIGLYGGWPFEAARPVARAEAPIIQLRDVAPGEVVGYGSTWGAERPARIATVSAGYADGLIRALSGSGRAFVGGTPAPIAGRVSMDLVTLDVTGIDCAPGDMVEFLGARQSIDDLARAAGTIGHEILTSLGQRYRRSYVSAE